MLRCFEVANLALSGVGKLNEHSASNIKMCCRALDDINREFGVGRNCEATITDKSLRLSLAITDISYDNKFYPYFMDVVKNCSKVGFGWINDSSIAIMVEFSDITRRV